jgi:hypothetical protein
MPVADRGDGAMVDAGRNGLDLRRLQALHDLVRSKPRGEVDVAHREIEQIVPHRAADVTGQPLAGAERVEEPLHPAAAAPFFGIDPQVHCSLRERLTIMAAVAPQILRPFQRIS